MAKLEPNDGNCSVLEVFTPRTMHWEVFIGGLRLHWTRLNSLGVILMCDSSGCVNWRRGYP